MDNFLSFYHLYHIIFFTDSLLCFVHIRRFDIISHMFKSDIDSKLII